MVFPEYKKLPGTFSRHVIHLPPRVMYLCGQCGLEMSPDATRCKRCGALHFTKDNPGAGMTPADLVSKE